jgi:hypothetical protein
MAKTARGRGLFGVVTGHDEGDVILGLDEAVRDAGGNKHDVAGLEDAGGAAAGGVGVHVTGVAAAAGLGVDEFAAGHEGTFAVADYHEVALGGVPQDGLGADQAAHFRVVSLLGEELVGGFLGARQFLSDRIDLGGGQVHGCCGGRGVFRTRRLSALLS